MRGFSIDQFEKRTLKAQQLMQNHGLDALLLTTETNVRYFTGFLTRFWESPTRPWYLIIPSKGKPIAVIPSIGEALMSKTWLDDIRTWPSPDLKDDGISLLTDTLKRLRKIKTLAFQAEQRRMFACLGPIFKNYLKMSTSDFDIMKKLRMTKSNEEIDKIKNAYGITRAAVAFQKLLLRM